MKKIITIAIISIVLVSCQSASISEERTNNGEIKVELLFEKYGISEDGDSYLHIDNIPDEGLNGACKSCIKIYNKLP